MTVSLSATALAQSAEVQAGTAPAGVPATTSEPGGDAPPPVADPQASVAPVAASEPPPVSEPAAVAAEPAPPQTATPEAAAAAGGKPGPSYQHSLYFGSPIWMSNVPVDPGFEFEVRDGIKLGALVPELGFGMRWNWTNVDKIRANYPNVAVPEAYAGEDLHGFWLSLGVRIEPEVKGKITPYGSVAFDALMWGASFDRSEVCGIWSCGTVRNYDFAPGFSGRAGIRIAPKPFIGIDLGAKVGMSFPGWAFEDTQSWVEPYAGITLITGPKAAGRATH